MNKLGIFAAAMLALSVGQTANADITFTQAQLAALTFDSTSGTPVVLTGFANLPAPTHADGTPMGGIQGIIQETSSTFGGAFNILYGVDVAIDATGNNNLTLEFSNDNNSTWLGGLWVEDGSGARVVGPTTALPALGPPGIPTRLSVSLAGIDASDIVKIGVIIGAENLGTAPDPSAVDAAHMSFAPVPEPGTMILWGTFAALGGVPALRRRRQA
ncbi:hypothetical protein KOR42_40410 [Thalassoglobus neptunius]|uniref:PEP-CTERM protein-sorting domain-containing protein n=1 Tax=Thalassoglobus neptunius TaxID=1938619 RepID=A0A5C5WBT3_9PLAN|nr:hypothetical protein [Thalassoglobus neptunius]TWT47957.1 hypothetical protein KOR42_40410 [Thalassoglobus neptunius]